MVDLGEMLSTVEKESIWKYCQTCGDCCKRYDVSITFEEGVNIVNFTGLSFFDFSTWKFPRTLEQFDFRFFGARKFKHKRNSKECIFLCENEGVYSCGIYDVRPSVCCDYPYTVGEKENCLEKNLDSDSGVFKLRNNSE